jgi:hypothetical protein
MGDHAMMEGMGWMMGAVGLIGLLVVIALLLGMAALVKYLRS